MIKAVIFDLDGTLLYTLGDISSAVNKALARYNLPGYTEEEYRAMVGYGLKKLVEGVIPLDKKGLIDKVYSGTIDEYYSHPVVNTYLYPGIRSMLDKLKSLGVKMSILSNKEDSLVQIITEKLFIPGDFVIIQGQKKEFKPKPSPDSVYPILKAMGVNTSECIFVGDSGADMKTAQNAGLLSIGVSWGYRDAEYLKNEGADSIAELPDDIVNFILRSKGSRRMIQEELKIKIDEYLTGEKNQYFIEDLKKVIAAGDTKELNDRFYTTLAFGTGGLRGKIGGGYNRMNPFVVRRATQGLGAYIKKHTSSGSAVIAFDSRNFSTLFAEEAALVLCSMGIKTYLFSSLRPTPVLSYAVRLLGTTAGIVVTASHNPAEYNGYKVYWSDGGQIVPPHDSGIINEVNSVKSVIEPVTREEALSKGLLEIIDSVVDEKYVSMVKSCSLRPELLRKNGKDLKIVYTPLHGAGTVLVERVLGEMGVNVTTVPEQREPDGDFPTVEYPNPEIASALKLGIELSEKESADMLMGTDPDADRLGIAVPDGDKMVLVTGNQLGVLLADYIFSSHKELGTLPKKSAFVKTIVTTELQRLVAESYGAKSYDVLTGFKYIAEKIKEFESTGERYIFGGEESYGYLVTDKVRDKDAVSAAFMAVEMTLYHRLKGKSVLDRLKEIWDTFGYFEELLVSRYFEGQEGKAVMDGLMKKFRNEPPSVFGGIKVESVKDYLEGVTVTSGSRVKDINLPSANVIQLYLVDGSKVTVRPSGTEPKIKFYASCRTEPGVPIEEAKNIVGDKLKEIENSIDKLL